MCCGTSWPDELQRVPDSQMGQRARDAARRYKSTPPEYHANVAIRVTVIALLAIGIIAAIACTHSQQFLQGLKNINCVYLATGLAAFTVLSIGANIVIHKAVHTIDPLTGTTIGKLSGDEKWVSACYQYGQSYEQGYIDTLTLDDQDSGVAYMYVHKTEDNHYFVSLEMIAFTPLHMAGAIVYNALRLVWIPFYIMGCMLAQKCGNERVEEEDRFRFSDIPKEMANSICRIVKAPFYATAVMFCAFLSFFDPHNFRRLGALMEREWNGGLTRAELFWIAGPERAFAFEGGGTRKGLGKDGFLLARCWQPIAVVHYTNNHIDYIEHLTPAVYRLRTGSEPLSNYYRGFTRPDLVREYNEAINQLNSAQL